MGGMLSYLAYSAAFSIKGFYIGGIVVLVFGIKMGVGQGLARRQDYFIRGIGFGLLLSIALGSLIFFFGLCGTYVNIG
jgi:hypothetical protein